VQCAGQKIPKIYFLTFDKTIPILSKTPFAPSITSMCRSHFNAIMTEYIPGTLCTYRGSTVLLHTHTYIPCISRYTYLGIAARHWCAHVVYCDMHDAHEWPCPVHCSFWVDCVGSISMISEGGRGSDGSSSPREGDISRKISGMSGKGKTYAVHAALLSIHKPTGQQIH
jgi:hypothetical protein